jgi:hypothetical protein
MSLSYVIVDVSTDTPPRGTSWRSACRSSPTRRHQTLARYLSKIVLSAFPATCYRQANEGSADP